MSKAKSGALPAPEPVILIVLPDQIARSIHRKLQRLDQDLDSPPPGQRRPAALPRRRRSSTVIVETAA
jgi:hypothetical protein